MSRKPGDLITKDPNSDEPQGFDWTKYLLELGPGVIINTSTWIITGADAVLTKHDEAIVTGPPETGSRATSATQLYYAAGTPGVRYTCTNRIVTNSSPPVTDDRSFDVLVQDR
jgi:hypothetical protein